MTEEEIIDLCRFCLQGEYITAETENAIQGLLDLYNKAKSEKQLKIDTAEEVLKWKAKYHFLSRKIGVVSKDKIKSQIELFKKEGSQTSLIIASVLEDLLKE